MDRENSIRNVSIDSIVPNRFQPRLIFDENLLQELAKSIQNHGIIQPLVLRRLNDKFEIVTGERRFKAAQIAGLKEVPAIIVNINDKESAEIALVENLQRKNLSPIEEAKSYKTIISNEDLTQDELADKIGINQNVVANKLKLLGLAPEVQDALANEKISEGHARSLLKVSDGTKQLELLNRILNERLTVKQLDDILKADNPSSDITTAPVEVTKPEENIIPEPTSDDKVTINTEDDDMETLDFSEVPKPKVGLFNIFNNIPSAPPAESLDDLQTNMSTGDDSFYNPFASLEVEEATKSEEPIVPEEPVVIQEEPKIPEKLIESGNLDSVKKAIEKLNTEIKDAGFAITTEDYDFSDLYQVIIKINKETN